MTEPTKTFTGKIASFNLKFKDAASKAMFGARVVDNSVSSYNLGYNFGCSVAKNPSLLTQPQTVYQGIDIEQYTIGVNQGYAACYVAPPAAVQPPSNSGGGGGGCVYVDCTYVSDGGGEGHYDCAPAGYTPCVE